MKTITYKDLIKLKFKENQAHDIIRRAKKLLVQKGYGYYNGKRIGAVPAWAVSNIIAISFDKEDGGRNDKY